MIVMTEVTLMGFGPVGLAVVVVTEAAQEGEKPGLGAAQVVDSIGASAAKIPDGFVGGVGNVDGNEVVGAKFLASFMASRLSVLMRSPDLVGMREGAMTSQVIPIWRRRRAIQNPHPLAS